MVSLCSQELYQGRTGRLTSAVLAAAKAKHLIGFRRDRLAAVFLFVFLVAIGPKRTWFS